MQYVDTIIQFIQNNQLIFWLIFTAIVASMPELLPHSWKSAPQWLWTWIRSSLKTFSNFRRSPGTAVINGNGNIIKENK